VSFGVSNYGTVSGRVFNDLLLAGGTPAASMPGLSGMRIILHQIDAGVDTITGTTDASGSYEFRNVVRDAVDLAATLIARCNGPKSFFPLTRALYKDQPNWVAKVQQVPPEQFEALQGLPPAQVPIKAAQFAGLQQWAAARGVPEAKSSQCLTSQAEIDRVVQMTSDVSVKYPNFSGTPNFVIDGKLDEKIAGWPDLEAKLREALR
jgi:protein-disulfide isomerase